MSKSKLTRKHGFRYINVCANAELMRLVTKLVKAKDNGAKLPDITEDLIKLGSAQAMAGDMVDDGLITDAMQVMEEYNLETDEVAEAISEVCPCPVCTAKRKSEAGKSSEPTQKDKEGLNISVMNMSTKKSETIGSLPDHVKNAIRKALGDK